MFLRISSNKLSHELKVLNLNEGVYMIPSKDLFRVLENAKAPTSLPFEYIVFFITEIKSCDVTFLVE